MCGGDAHMTSRRLAVVVLLLLAVLGGQPGTGAADSSIETVGTFHPVTVSPRFFPGPVPYARQLRLMTDERARRLVTVDSLSPGFAATYDLDTLKPVDKGIDLLGMRNEVIEVPEHQWIVVATSSAGGTDRIEVVSAASGKAVHVGALAIPNGLGSTRHQVVGMAAVPGSRLLFALARIVAGGSTSGTMTVSLLDLDGVESGGGGVRWTLNLPDCLEPVNFSSFAAMGYVPQQQAVYFGCADSSAGTTATRQPVPGGAGRVRVTLADGLPDQPDGFTLFPREGDFRQGLSAFDPTTDRLLLSAGRSNTGWSLFSFDTHNEAWVGSLAVGPIILDAMGVDATHGRFYARSQSIGLLAADVATTPLEQGRNIPPYANRLPDDFERSGLGVAAPFGVDDATQRIFLPPYADHETNQETEVWYVLRDHRPPYVEPPTQDPDTITQDIEEVKGETGRTFSASAQAYGSRTRQVGGSGALTSNAGAGDFGGTSSGTREVATAFLDKLTLNDSEATARAASATRDEETTGSDQSQACNEQVEQTCEMSEWPVSPAQCIDFGGEATSDSIDDSTVTCDREAGLARATSEGGASQTGGVGSSGSSVEASLTLDDDRGAVASASASADGISFLEGAVTMGRVEATAEVVARGRSGTATGTYHRTVRDVSVGGQTICTDDCDVEEVAAVINERFVGRARISFPDPDPDLLAGSPRGAQAVSQRGFEEHVQAVIMDGQDSSRVEVPGMVLWLYQDKDKPSRTVYEFAGTQVEARYGVFRLAPGGGDQPPPEGGNEPSNTPPEPAPQPGETPPGPIFHLGGDSPAASPTSPDVAPDADDGPLSSFVEAVRIVVANGLGQALTLFVVWLLLLLPIYLSARRSLFAQRDTLSVGSNHGVST